MKKNTIYFYKIKVKKGMFCRKTILNEKKWYSIKKEELMKEEDVVVCLNNMLKEISYIKLKSKVENINEKLK